MRAMSGHAALHCACAALCCAAGRSTLARPPRRTCLKHWYRWRPPPSTPQMYAHIREEMAKGHGIYIVCPFVEQSDKMVRAQLPSARGGQGHRCGHCILRRVAIQGRAPCTNTLIHWPHPWPCAPLLQEEVKAATQELERLVQEGVFARDDCGLLHGQMAPADKDAVLARFKAGQLKLLVRWAGSLGLRFARKAPMQRPW